jgi:hypothetical protein
MRGPVATSKSAARSMAADRPAPLAGFMITIVFTVAFWLALAHFAAMALGFPLAAATLLNIAIGLTVVLGAAVAPVFLATDRS